MTIVTVVDYGVGNLHSIVRALRRAGAEVLLTGDQDEVARAERLLLPGVGAFGHCAANLRAAGMLEPIHAFVTTGRPFLSICVGMQLLFEQSSEFGAHEGLALIPGSVDMIPAMHGDSVRKVPHSGWGALQFSPGRPTWAGTPLGSLRPGFSSAYFVHSYAARPTDPAHRLADVDYQGFNVCAAVQRDNILGFQFHPETSGAVGLSVLEAFVSSTPAKILF